MQAQGPATTWLRFPPMPSGKRAKQQRRQAAAPPPVRSKGGPGLGARQASPRTLAIAGGVILVVIVAVVLAVVLSKGSGSSNEHSDTSSIHIVNGTGPFPDAPEVANTFKGIQQNGFVLGDPNAPVTLVEYIDLQCPVCKDFETTELAPLIATYVRPGKLKIEMKPWNILDAADGTIDSLRGQKAVIAAAQQNKAFTFAQVLYENQQQEGTNWMDDLMISRIAASVDGLDTSKFVTDANSQATANLIKSIDNYGNNQLTTQVYAAGQRPGTPTLLLAKGNGKPKVYGVGLPDLPSLESAINKLLPAK